MHEAAIVKSLIDQVEEMFVTGAITGRVLRVHLKVGKLTAVVPDVMRFMFDAAIPDTKLAGARMTMDEIQVSAKCNACGAVDDILDIGFYCGSCGSTDIDVISGRELMIDSVEVEDGD